MLTFLARRKGLSLGLIGIAFLIALGLGKPARGDPGGVTLEVSPGLIVIGPDKKAPMAGTLSLINRGSEPIKIKVYVADFSQNTDGTINFLASGNSPLSSASWVALAPKEFEAPPDQETKVDYQISIPPGAEPGDHNAAIFFETGDEAKAGNVQIKARVATLMLVNVPGETAVGSTLTNFKVPGFSGGGTINFAFTLRNYGNKHLALGDAEHARIEITDLFGHSTASVPLPNLLVMPQSSRKITVPWDNPPLWGRFKARLIIDTGGPEPLVRETYIYIVPWRQMTAGLFFVVGLWLIVTSSWGREAGARVKYAAKVLVGKTPEGQ